MAELTYESERISPVMSRPQPVVSRPHWGAIWSGVFTFIAIWSVFGLLGMAIFSSAANPNHAALSTGIGVGMGIWSIVLTIIAMYVAGRVTGRLAGIDRSSNGVIHGMIMFGLSVASVLVITALGSTAAASTSESVPALMHMSAGLGWAGFLSLLLGWLAAMGGAATGTGRANKSEKRVQEIRSAA